MDGRSQKMLQRQRRALAVGCPRVTSKAKFAGVSILSYDIDLAARTSCSFPWPPLGLRQTADARSSDVVGLRNTTWKMPGPGSDPPNDPLCRGVENGYAPLTRSVSLRAPESARIPDASGQNQRPEEFNRKLGRCVLFSPKTRAGEPVASRKSVAIVLPHRSIRSLHVAPR